MIRLTRRQSREVDRIAIEEYHIPSIVLMENAARSITDAVDAFRTAQELAEKCVVFCGKGNNGGDGFAAGRHLHNRGYDILFVLTAPPDGFIGDAGVNYRIARAMNLPMKPFDDFSGWEFGFAWIALDAIYGTGFRPPSNIDLARVNELVRAQLGGVVAVDLPSGMDADTGKSDPTQSIIADLTVTLATEKAGFGSAEAQKRTGRIVIGDIGVPTEVIDRAAMSPA